MGRLTYEYIKEFIENYGCELLSTEYVNNHTKLQIRCTCGEVFEKTFHDFNGGNQRQCPKCGLENKRNKRRMSYEYVKEFIKNCGCELLSTEYVNNSTKLQIRCACGEVFEKSFNKFKGRNQRQCPKCGLENKRNKRRMSYEYVKEFIESYGCELISTKYESCKAKLQIKCACGEVFETTFDAFKNANQRQCPKCGLSLITGENNYRYNPNMTVEERELRRETPNYKKFVKKVYARDNYTCRCCGDNRGRNLNAHHLNGYHWDKKHRTSKLNGITLCEGCHNEFHSMYGKGNNTIIQFREFIYKKYLQTNDPKYLTILKDIDIRITLLVDNLTLSLVN